MKDTEFVQAKAGGALVEKPVELGFDSRDGRTFRDKNDYRSDSDHRDCP